MSGPLFTTVCVLLGAGFVVLFAWAARSHPPTEHTTRRSSGPWRAPRGGGYQLDEARPEPGTPPRGPAGTSR